MLGFCSSVVRRRRRVAAVLAATVLSVTVASMLAACGGPGGGSSNPNPNPNPQVSSASGPDATKATTVEGVTPSFTSEIVDTPADAPGLPTTIAGYSPYEPGKTVVAELLAGEPSLAVYDSPVSTTPTKTLPRNGKHEMVLVTLGGTPDRLLVELPVRPNGSRGWIDKTKMKLGSHDFKLIVELSSHKLIAMKGTAEVLNVPIGVGKGQTPTPNGTYYITELLQPPNPDSIYGTYAYGLSGFSEVLNSFGGGDGQVGIHGTNDPSSIGKDVSHGCIRLNNADIEKLVKMLPLGTPVEVLA